MAEKNNVIDIRGRLKAKQASAKKSKEDAQGQVISMSNRRQEELAAERRHVTRTVLAHIVGVLIETRQGLQPVALYDVSESGVAFDLPMEIGSYSKGESVILRMYMSHDLYFSFAVRVANVRPIDGMGVNRHGAVLVKSDNSYKAVYFFIKFLEQLAQVTKRDTGERLFGRID